MWAWLPKKKPKLSRKIFFFFTFDDSSKNVINVFLAPGKPKQSMVAMEIKL